MLGRCKYLKSETIQCMLLKHSQLPEFLKSDEKAKGVVIGIAKILIDYEIIHLSMLTPLFSNV